jgi:hypothetical protein
LIHCAITVPCAVDPDDRRLPFWQVKPEPAKVRAAVDPELAGGCEAIDPAADEPAAMDPAAPDPGAIDPAADDPAAGAAEEAGAAADPAAAAAELLVDGALEFELLPQAVRANAPATSSASVALIRVVCTRVLHLEVQFSIELHQGAQRITERDAADGRTVGWTSRRAWMNRG